MRARPASFPAAAGRPAPRPAGAAGSSTFQDMQAERDRVRELVDPPLRALCASRGLFYHSVDLRWGITDEACARGLVTRLCLREVARCTHFVAFLKGARPRPARPAPPRPARPARPAPARARPDALSARALAPAGRYGWHLDPAEPPDAAGNALFTLNLQRAAEEFPWVAEWSDRSVTEIEILAGALLDVQGARGRSLFYVADEALAREAGAKAGGAGGVGEGPHAARRLRALKARIAASGLPVRGYSDPAQLALALRDELTSMVESEYPAEGERSWLEAERAGQEAFAASRVRVFAGDEADAAALDDYAAGDGPELLVLTGPGGSGKTALLANWSRRAALATLARRVSEELRARWPREPPLDASGPDAEVAPRLRAALASGAGRWPSRLVLVVDGLDQLQGDAAAAARRLAWLPDAAGPSLRLLVSCLPGPALAALAAPGRPLAPRELRPLDAPRRRRVLEATLAEQGRALSEAQAERVAGAAPCANPLFLTTLLEELSSTSVHARLDEDIGALLACGDPPGLFRHLLRRLAARHGAGLVAGAAGAVACARHGVAEAELAALLGVGAPEPAPPRVRARWSELTGAQVAWSSLWYELLPSSSAAVRAAGPRPPSGPAPPSRPPTPTPPAEGLYGFFHRCAAEAAEAEFGLEDEAGPARRGAHVRLGAFFAAQPPGRRRAEEAPWALARAGPERAGALAALLCDYDVLDRLNRLEAASLWRAAGLEAEAAARYGAALGLGTGRARAPELCSAAEVLGAMGRAGEGVPFVQEAMETFEGVLGAGHLRTAASVVGLGTLLSQQGRYEEAAEMFEARAGQGALRVRREALGDGHPDAAGAKLGLALALRELGRFEEAQTLCEEALEAYRAALGPEHADTAGAMQALALCLRERGEHAAARPLYEEALRARRRAQGPEHPDAASAAVGLAGLLFETGQRAEARALQEALRVRGAALGPEHPETAMAAHNLANALRAEGNLAAARPLFERALGAFRRSLPAGHPDTATAARNYAGLLEDAGELAAARDLYEEALGAQEGALAAYRRALGARHATTAMAARNYAGLLAHLGEHAAARKLFQEALVGYEAAFGAGHARTEAVRQALAALPLMGARVLVLVADER
eukprot:tig00000042_g15507.t1